MCRSSRWMSSEADECRKSQIQGQLSRLFPVQDSHPAAWSPSHQQQNAPVAGGEMKASHLRRHKWANPKQAMPIRPAASFIMSWDFFEYPCMLPPLEKTICLRCGLWCNLRGFQIQKSVIQFPTSPCCYYYIGHNTFDGAIFRWRGT